MDFGGEGRGEGSLFALLLLTTPLSPPSLKGETNPARYPLPRGEITGCGGGWWWEGVHLFTDLQSHVAGRVSLE